MLIHFADSPVVCARECSRHLVHEPMFGRVSIGNFLNHISEAWAVGFRVRGVLRYSLVRQSQSKPRPALHFDIAESATLFMVSFSALSPTV